VPASNLGGRNFELNDKYRHSWVQELHIDDSYDEWAPPEKMVLNR